MSSNATRNTIQSGGEVNGIRISNAESFKHRILTFPIGAAENGSTSKTFDISPDDVDAGFASAANLGFPFRILLARLNNKAPFGTNKVSTLTVTAGSTQILDTTGSPALNVIGEGASAGTQVATAGDVTRLVLTDAAKALEITAGTLFTATLASTSATPGATGLELEIVLVGVDMLDEPGAAI